MHCTSPGNVNLLENVNKAISDGQSYDDFQNDWSSPTHIARSNSWFCCSNETREQQPSLHRRRPISCQYSIIRNEPKSQSEIVKIVFFLLNRNRRRELISHFVLISILASSGGLVGAEN